MGIKNQLMEKYGLTEKEATNLISTNGRNHDGKVNLREIEEDVEKIANSIIFNLGKLFRDYDVAHEIFCCGKDSQRDGLMSLMEDGYDEIALKYLANNFWENVDIWVKTFCDAARHMVLEGIEKTNQDNISGYRDFVNRLPFKNIYAVACFLDIESEVVELIAKYGDEKDFQTYMTSTEYVRDNYDSSTQRVERRSCPSALSKKILSKVREELAENGEIKFNRRTMMAGLSAIHRNKYLSDEQKEELQELYMTKSLRGYVDGLFVDFVKAEKESPYEAIKEYLEKVDKETQWYEKEEIMNKNILPVNEKKMQVDYDELLEKLEEQSKSEELTTEKFMEILNKSKLAKRSMRLEKDEETSKVTLIITLKHPVIRHEEIEVKIEADRLQEIIDKVNAVSLSKANEELEAIAQKGMGEIKVLNTYEIERRFKYSREKVLGAISEEEDSPYVVGGKITDDEKLTDLQVMYPYPIISEYIGLAHKDATMTPEQIEQFNRVLKQVEVSTHLYTYGRVDGYYRRTVYDFEVDGEQYHIKGADWTNGGVYDVIWKGEEKEENYPKEAIGLSSSRSEWARCQSGVNEEAAIRLILANPTRFSKIIDEGARISDCCGLYPTIHLEDLCRELMRMEPESVLKEEKEVEHSKAEEAYTDKIVEEATKKVELQKTESKAEELLTEYEEIDGKKQNSLDDE